MNHHSTGEKVSSGDFICNKCKKIIRMEIGKTKLELPKCPNCGGIVWTQVKSV